MMALAPFTHYPGLFFLELLGVKTKQCQLAGSMETHRLEK